jgi:hypothetical protein
MVLLNKLGGVGKYRDMQLASFLYNCYAHGFIFSFVLISADDKPVLILYFINKVQVCSPW